MGKRSRKRGDAVPAAAVAPARPSASRGAAGSPARTALAPRTARSRRGTRCRSSSCACSWASCCWCSACWTCVRDRGKLMLVLRHGPRLARRPGHRPARAPRRLPLPHDGDRGAAAVTTAAVAYFAGAPWPALIVAAVAVFAAVFWLMRRVVRAQREPGAPGVAASLYAVSDEKRMQLRGLHHVTAICRRRWSRRSPSTATCSGSRSSTTGRPTTIPARATCGSARWTGGPGHARVASWSTRELPTGVVGVGLDPPLRASLVDSADEQDAWRDYLRDRGRRVLRRASTAARSARSTCAIPTATWSRSPPAGPASRTGAPATS